MPSKKLSNRLQISSDMWGNGITIDAHSSSNPSGYDIVLLTHLAIALEHEGLPALMLIVGEHEENWVVGKVA